MACPDCGEPRACRRKVSREGERCRFHGGASLKGTASPSFKTGRYSKYLPAGLAARYKDAQKDPELLSLRDDVALLDARLAELVEKLDTGETKDLWSALRDTYERLTTARDQGKTRDMARALLDLGDLIGAGHEQGRVWDSIVALLDQRRRLVESERKRLIEMRQMISSERAMVLVTALIDAVSRRVTDRQVLSQIAADFRTIVGEPDRIEAG
jgi:hypothetical protein